MTYKGRLAIALCKQRCAERNRCFDEANVARAESQGAIR